VIIVFHLTEKFLNSISIKNVAMFWDIASCSPYVNRLFRASSGSR
jgi:hypothetical protein